MPAQPRAVERDRSRAGELAQSRAASGRPAAGAVPARTGRKHAAASLLPCPGFRGRPERTGRREPRQCNRIRQGAVRLPADANGIDGATLLSNLYGIGSGYSGLGFAVKGSFGASLTTAQTLVGSVVPEYLLNNVSLAKANCSCVRVPNYDGRDEERLSPRFISAFGKLAADGSCRTVSRIVF
jgi:hypothetical protein